MGDSSAKNKQEAEPDEDGVFGSVEEKPFESQTQMDNDSIHSQEPQAGQDGKKEKSRRPPNTAFRQQRLKAWQPILTPKTVLPLFFAVGVIFAPLGGLLLWASSQVQELSIEYQHCTRDATANFTNVPSDLVSSHFKNSTTPSQVPQWRTYNDTVSYHNGTVNVETAICQLRFWIPDDLAPPVLFYYQLTNFYQNHRRYVKSLDADQLKGNFRDNDTIDGSDCDPLRIDGNTGKAYYPCGLIANSMFNDSFVTPRLLNQRGDADPVDYNMTNKGIAWSSDGDLYKNTAYTADQVSPPPNWRIMYPEYNESIPIPNIHDWEEFHVWMRTAGLPSFSKLALRNDTATMRSGQYEMEIRDYFPVTIYGGTKSILLSTRTIMGGRNPFLGIAYIVVAGVCIVLGALFTATHLIRPRKLGDHTYLSWNNDQPSTGTTTGRA
ncbi:Lem3/Cdc50 [Aureobasidium pullulans]|nr:Lem3/Cdc50 [Aureobasidium pullulans]